MRHQAASQAAAVPPALRDPPTVQALAARPVTRRAPRALQEQAEVHQDTLAPRDRRTRAARVVAPHRTVAVPLMAALRMAAPLLQPTLPALKEAAAPLRVEVEAAAAPPRAAVPGRPPLVALAKASRALPSVASLRAPLLGQLLDRAPVAVLPAEVLLAVDPSPPPVLPVQGRAPPPLDRSPTASTPALAQRSSSAVRC